MWVPALGSWKNDWHTDRQAWWGAMKSNPGENRINLLLKQLQRFKTKKPSCLPFGLELLLVPACPGMGHPSGGGGQSCGQQQSGPAPLQPRAQLPCWGISAAAPPRVPWALGQGWREGALEATGMERPRLRAGEP